MRPVASFQASDAVAEDRSADSGGGGGRDGEATGGEAARLAPLRWKRKRKRTWKHHWRRSGGEGAGILIGADAGAAEGGAADDAGPADG